MARALCPSADSRTLPAPRLQRRRRAALVPRHCLGSAVPAWPGAPCHAPRHQGKPPPLCCCGQHRASASFKGSCSPDMPPGPTSLQAGPVIASLAQRLPAALALWNDAPVPAPASLLTSAHLQLDNLRLSCADVTRADAKLGDFGLARLAVEGERRRKEGQHAAHAGAT